MSFGHYLPAALGTYLDIAGNRFIELNLPVRIWERLRAGRSRPPRSRIPLAIVYQTGDKGLDATRQRDAEACIALRS